MKNQQLTNTLLLFFALPLLFVSCLNDASPDVDLADEDMLHAIDLADQYLISAGGRGDDDKAVTVLKFNGDELQFHTNGETNGYEETGEQSITAEVVPGEYIFWYGGGGITDLEGIEFDGAAQAYLVDDPDEIHDDKMWVIKIPEHDDDDDDDDVLFLKYDIIYKHKETNTLIRLDPKLKVTH